MLTYCAILYGAWPVLIYRFAKDDMSRLASALALPELYVCSQGTRATGMEALMVLLRRLAYPSRWCDLVSLFGRTEPELSMIFNTVSKCVHSLLCISEIIVHFCAICLC